MNQITNSISYITLLIYPIIGFILLFGSKKFKNGEFNEGYASISETKAIQGIIALCIVCHHTAQQTCVEWLESGNIVHGLDVFSNTGFLFVSVFFFWSGYGLYKSVSSKPRYLNGFIKKRVFPVWFPYVIVCFLFTFVRLFILNERMPLWFKITNFTGITIGYYFGWYVQAILLFYIIFYFAFKKTRYEADAIIYVWVGVVAWIIAGLIVDHNDYFLRGQWWYNSTLLFAIGVSFAKSEEKFINWMKKRYKTLMPASALMFFITFFISRIMEMIRGYYGEYAGVIFATKMIWRIETYLTQVIAAILFVLVTILISLKMEFNNKVLGFLGNHTLEIYLTHAFFLETFAILYNYHKDSFFYGRPWILLVTTIVLTMPAAVVLKKLTKIAYQLLNRK